MDYTASLKEIQEYYQNLLIVQYHDKKKAKALIANLVKHLFADMILFKIRDGFNILNQPYAVGKQLDCIGEWVGVNRIYDAGQPLYPWFSLINAEQTTTDAYQGGFQDWNDTIAENGGVLGFDDLVMGTNSVELEDDLFLSLIKLKIIKNSSTHTMGDLDRKFKEYFDNGIYITWNGMTMTYNYTNDYNAIIEVAKVKNAIPIPNGMIVNYNPL